MNTDNPTMTGTTMHNQDLYSTPTPSWAVACTSEDGALDWNGQIFEGQGTGACVYRRDRLSDDDVVTVGDVEVLAMVGPAQSLLTPDSARRLAAALTLAADEAEVVSA